MGELYLKSILNNFLTIEQNKKLYEEYKINLDKRVLDILENEFKKFYSKIIIVSYFSKALHFAAQKYDQGIKKYRRFEDELFERNENVFYIDEYKEHEPDNIANYVEDQDISESITNLKDRQKQILYLHFIREMTEAEIARVLNISQQAVNKAKNKAIDEIRPNTTK
ncbi:sigma-70 family RNA polymerase sigma factor [Lysinibacillus sp. FW12]|uniref:sigma-70 family RNA polymerase sigma factor n=1 Tax=Lysinibacillus sp. FW12 TaxID=3096079 RepID=UPI003D71ED61